MLIDFFLTLRRYEVPVTIRELLDLLQAMQARLVYSQIDDFYLLARTLLVKDESHYDKFDRAFGAYFKGLEDLHGILASLVPDEWLRREFERSLSPEDLEKINSIAGLEKLLKAFHEAQGKGTEADEKAQEPGEGGRGEQAGRGGQGPNGAGGVGKKPKGKRAWNQRQYRNLDSSVELGTRNIKLALRRLRKLARSGRETELDLTSTIRSTAHNGGLLDIRMRAERKNQVKVLCFFDVGGSMDAHVKVCEELFSAARTEFKHMEYFYFHNFLYDTVWRDNRRRMAAQLATWDLLNKYPRDYRVVVVGDATMAPYEITHSGGSVEHWNEEPGALWMHRYTHAFDKLVWINPTPQETWEYAASVQMIQALVGGRMFPLTINGLETAMNELSR